MNETALTLFYWIPKLFFVLLFLVVGYFGIKHKMVSHRFIIWLFILYVFERVIEISVRVNMSFSEVLSEGYTSLAYNYYSATLLPTLKDIMIREVVIILIAAVVWGILYLYAKRTAFQKLDSADVGIFAFGVIVSGWPNFLIYLLVVFALALIGLVVSGMIRKTETMIVTPYFALAGIIIIFWGWELSKLIGLYGIR